MWRLAGSLFGGLAVSACVVGAERPASRVGVARAPVDGSPLSSDTGSADGCSGDRMPPARPSPGAVYVDGYCHFDGVRYSFHQGHWEAPRSRNP